jgi:hypothetical protein
MCWVCSLSEILLIKIDFSNVILISNFGTASICGLIMLINVHWRSIRYGPFHSEKPQRVKKAVMTLKAHVEQKNTYITPTFYFSLKFDCETLLD